MAPKKKQSKEELLRKKREAEKRRQERIKSDPERLMKEKEKWKAKYKTRKDKGQVKLVADMSKREVRNQRKIWKRNQKNHRDKVKNEEQLNNYLCINSPPESIVGENNIEAEPIPGPSQIRRSSTSKLGLSNGSTEKNTPNSSNEKSKDGRSISGKKRKNRRLAKAYRELNKYKEKYEVCLRKIRMYQKRLQRNAKPSSLQSKLSLTPKTKINNFLKGKKVDNEVRRKLIFGEVFQSQVANHYSDLKKNKEKQSMRQIICTKVLKNTK